MANSDVVLPAAFEHEHEHGRYLSQWLNMFIILLTFLTLFPVGRYSKAEGMKKTGTFSLK